MKINNLYALCVVGGLASFSSYAACIAIEGNVRTQAINQLEQVGKIRISSDSVIFKNIVGQSEIEGGIHGTIDRQVPVITLHHQIGFSGIGALTSTGDQAIITGEPDSLGNYPVTESVKIDPTNSYFSGAFFGWSFQNVVAKGVVNLTTGVNSFKLSGKLCQ